MPDEILRTFIAVELDETLRIAIASVQEKLKRQVPPGSVKWVAPGGIHLTLKFLGDTPSARLTDIQAALLAACAGFVASEFGVEGQGCFPDFRRPRVIWVAVKDRGQALARLQAAVERHISPLGWPTEERAFSPHLTLGRISRGADSQAAAAVGRAVEKSVIERIGVQRVSTVSLIRSDLQPTGPIYTSLLNVPLSV